MNQVLGHLYPHRRHGWESQGSFLALVWQLQSFRESTCVTLLFNSLPPLENVTFSNRNARSITLNTCTATKARSAGARHLLPTMVAHDQSFPSIHCRFYGKCRGRHQPKLVKPLVFPLSCYFKQRIHHDPPASTAGPPVCSAR